MDTKALAKSKRAHTQHHSSRRPHHHHSHNQTPTKVSSSSSDGSGAAKKPLAGKQAREKPQHPKPRPLPSNWDRYDDIDEFGSDPENLSANNEFHGSESDAVVPKSKGADYKHLIAEAQSQSDGFSCLDDVLLSDFNQGVGSILAVRGEGILSWTGDDSFIVEDRATTSNEASFLTLNLHALAEQLAKIELSKRLFIEADLLPPELYMEQLQTTSSQVPEKMQTCESMPHEGELAASVFQDFPEKVKVTNQSGEVTSSDTSGSGLADLKLSYRGPFSVNHIGIDLNQLGKSGLSKALESKTESRANSVVDAKASGSTFKAAAAEAELDMLLDSFSQTESLKSSGTGSIESSPVLGQEASTALPQVPDKSKTAPITANIDDVLDDLLDETSNLVNQSGLSQTHQVKPPHNVQSFPSSGTGTKSKVLDDFDSWLDTI